MEQCEHRVCLRVYRWRDVLVDVFRALLGKHGLTAEECHGPLVCRACGQVVK